MELPGLNKNQDFLDHPWKHRFFFNWPLELRYYIFSIYPKKLQVLNPPACLGFFFFFSGIAPIFILLLKLDFLDETHLPTRLFQKNFKQVGWWIYFSGNPPLEFLDLSLYLWKFRRKQTFTPGNSAKLCATLGNSKFKNQDPGKFHISF